MTHRPPTHREPTDEECLKLPPGSLHWNEYVKDWTHSIYVGRPINPGTRHHYAVPITKQEDAQEPRKTLRDEFAMAALTGFLASMQDPNEFQVFGKPEHAAITVYGYADAMLAARNNQPEKV